MDIDYYAIVIYYCIILNYISLPNTLYISLLIVYSLGNKNKLHLIIKELKINLTKCLAKYTLIEPMSPIIRQMK